jgi:hypothetical protein
MRNTLLALALASLPACSAVAEQPGSLKLLNKPVTSDKQLPVKGAGATSSCAAYGAGFVRVEGSNTCVRIGGNIDLEGRGRR